MKKEYHTDTFLILIIRLLYEILRQHMEFRPYILLRRRIIAKTIFPLFIKYIFWFQQNAMYIQQECFHLLHRCFKISEKYFYVFRPYFTSFKHSFHGHLAADIIIIKAAVIHTPSSHLQDSLQMIHFQHTHLVVFFIYCLFFNRNLTLHFNCSCSISILLYPTLS